MKLVRIDEDIALDIDDVQFAVWRTAREDVLIGFKSNSNSVTTVDKKVLDAICGSEEHLNDNSQQYNISITTGDSGSNFSGTMADVLKTLKELSEKEMLTIRR
ncbi:hypothetical protein [Pediococcus pentosaceus]|uniref:hypothetical protein n=1 Tax=Pediococcus pentosaceus TaxID=1255 RepID=UPI00159FBB6B|nr:hypothetical protein [Pediococcus pentosaceus]NVZ00192.1 hypothetical protein [Pediococcus pentosaceus]